MVIISFLLKLFLLMGCISTRRVVFGLRRSLNVPVDRIIRRISPRGQKSSQSTAKAALSDISIPDLDPADPSLPWYIKGLSFSCSMCGNCCSGSSGSVRFSDTEALQMASQTNLSTEDFYSKYTRRRGRGRKSYFELKEVRRDSGDMDCVFLDREKIPGKAICSLYGARPGQCRTWPFWSELLESEETWNNAKIGSEGCAGIGKGTVVPYEEIIRQRDLPTS